MHKTLRREDFLPLVGQTIDAETSAGQRAPVEVLEASRIMSPSPRSEPFRVIFRAAPNWQWPQGLYALHHPQLGPLHLFAVPIGPDDKGLCYEAIFN